MKKIIGIALAFILILTGNPLSEAPVDAVSGATSGGSSSTGVAPKAPSNLILQTAYTADSSSIKLMWVDNSTNESGFKLERKAKDGTVWAQIALVNSNSTSFTDTGLTAGITYLYRVKSWNTYGTSAASNELQVAIPENGSTTPVIPNPNSTPSAWAKEAVDKSIAAGLTVESLLNNYTNPITRAEFSALVVKLYESTVGTVETTGLFNPFSDTSDTHVLKAYKLGIVKGTSKDKFSPNANIARQEIAVMLQREFIASNDQGNSSVSSGFNTAFADENQIALWAIDAVRLMSEKGIIIGTGSGIFNPSGYATREQAMLMIYRSYEKFIEPLDMLPDDFTDDIEIEDDDEDDHEDDD